MKKSFFEESSIVKKLLKLDKKVLVEALLDASCRDEVTSSLINRLVSSRSENMIRFKDRLAEIAQERGFISWRHSAQYARLLEDLLEDLKGGITTAREGLESLGLFFEADQQIIEACDDSSGHVGDVFRFNGTKMFEEYAEKCEDKEFVANLLLDLILVNDYGLRDSLADNVASYLPEKQIRNIIKKLWERYQVKKSKKQFYSSELRLLEKMAKALIDPILYEEIIKEEGGENKDYDNFRLGKIWLKAGDHEKALSYLEKVDQRAKHYLNELNATLSEAYLKTGDIEKVKAIAWKNFRMYRSLERLNVVVKLEGNDERAKIIQDEVNLIHEEKELKAQTVEFLLEMELFDDANRYIVERKDGLNGDAYYCLPDWAKKLEKKRYYLVTVLIYRALLDSILERGYSKAYHHGVSYLKKLESLSLKVEDWCGSSTHTSYFEKVREGHKRKSSFWSKYNND